MISLTLKYGLLFADIELKNKDKVVEIKNVIVDTGAAHSIFLSDYLDDLNIDIEDNEELVVSYGYGGAANSSIRKNIDKVSIGDIEVNNPKVDFGEIAPTERINGLIGLDILRAAKIILDIDELKLFKKNKK